MRRLCLVGIILLLVGCTTQSSTHTDELLKRIESLETENAKLKENRRAPSAPKDSEQAFEKKRDCQQYIGEAKRILEDGSLDTGAYAAMWFFERIFYSQSHNSCLFTASQSTMANGQLSPNTLYGLFDVLSGERLMNTYDEEYFEGAVKKYE